MPTRREWTIFSQKLGFFHSLVLFLCASGSSLFISTITATAQAPASIAGTACGISITAGTGPFANFGYFIVLPGNTGSSYQLIGIYNVANDSGTYTYSPSGAIGLVTFNGSLGSIPGDLDFTSSSSGSYFVSASSFFQEGNFVMTASPAPVSVQGRSYYLSALTGDSPFASAGAAILTTSATGNNYTITPVGNGVVPSSGTYSYSLANTSTGSVQMSDSVAGASTTYFAYGNSTGGSYATKQSSSGAFQIGNFTFLNTGVAITSPTSGSNYVASSGTINLAGTATDNMGLSQVTWSNSGGGTGIASGTTSWIANNIALQGGTNTITVTAQDVVGKTAQAFLSVIYFIPPVLKVSLKSNNIILSWPTNSVGFKLESTTNFPATSWNSNSTAPFIINARYTITNALSGKAKFYRLTAP
jgi:hypothetical protein